MPLRLNVGLSKKIGQPHYGSLGASCHVDVELDSNLLYTDLEALHRHVKNAYVACAQAVNDELSRHTTPGNSTHETSSPSALEAVNGNGRNGGPPHNPSAPSNRATQKQFEYARQLAVQIVGLGLRRLETLADQMYTKPLAELSSLEASGMIDLLKDLKEGKLQLTAVLSEAPG